MRRYKINHPTFEHTPLGVTGFILDLLKDYFEINNLFPGITIALNQQWESGDCENYPALYLQRGQWGINRQLNTIGNNANYFMPNNGYGISRDAGVLVEYLIHGISQQYGELEILADEIFKFFYGFSPLILEQYDDIISFDLNSITPIQMIKEEKKYRKFTASLLMTIHYSWIINYEKHLIQEVKINGV